MEHVHRASCLHYGCPHLRDAPERRPRQVRRRVGGALLALGLAFGAGTVASDGDDASSDGEVPDTATVPAPDLAGLTSDEAQRAARTTGIGLMEQAAPAPGDDGIDPTDVVLNQIPEAGSPVGTGNDGLRVYYGPPSGG